MSEQLNGASSTSAASSRRSSVSRPAHRRALSGITPRELKCIDDVIPLDRRQKWKKYSAKPIETAQDFESEFVRNVETTLGRSLFNCDTLAAYQATARSLRDTLIVRWNRTQQKHTLEDPKRVYYLSLEFLMGRALDNAALNLGLEPDIKAGLDDFGFRFEDVVNREPDAGLGNGGLGRLAACFIDSLCTLDYPAWAYGIRYKYGIFNQKIIDGAQVERPDLWLDFGNPWEIPRPEVSFDVMFYGRVEGDDKQKKWVGGDLVEAKAYDFLVPGFETKNVNTLRLWQATPSSQFDFERFNEGDYSDAVADQVDASTISAVLYPNDNFYQGKELRLKQQYFWVAASLADIIRRYKKTGKPWSEFADSCAIQLNDTHPTLAIVELLRILVDKEGLGWHEAWAITTSTFAYTNHTVMPEALEKWGIDILGNLLPRHLEIVYQINFFFLKDVASKFPGDNDLLNRVSLIEESSPKQVRMAYLAVIASHKVNGVAELHSDLIKTTIFADFVKIFGESHFTNITNGITPRRWLLEANPKLAALIASKLGGIDFVKDLDSLKGLSKYVNDAEFRKEWNDVKHANKLRLIELIKSQNPGIEIDPTSLFDVQVKRIHEYKRQQLNLFGIVYRYLYLKSLTPEQRRSVAPRVFIFGGKSAPGYYAAKLIIKLINSVAKTIASEPEISKYLKIVYIEEYNVSKAQILVAASDISEHISTAGTEASGTSNMKFVLNGGLIIGTVDGANIEIGREIGEDNIYYFGHLSESVDEVRAETKNGVQLSDKLSKVFETIDSGIFGDASEFASLLDSIRQHGDYYLVNADFDSYINTQSKIDEDFKDKEGWTTKSITSVSKMGFFSSDRAINQYAEEIWDVRPNPVEGPDPLSPKPSHASLRTESETVSAAQGMVAARNVPNTKRNSKASSSNTAAATVAATGAGASAAALTAAAIAATGNKPKAEQDNNSYDPVAPGDDTQVKGAYGSYADKPTTHTGTQTGAETGIETGSKNDGQYYDPTTPGDEGQVKGAYGSYTEKPSTHTGIQTGIHTGTQTGAETGIETGLNNDGQYYDPTTPGDEGQVKGAYGSYADKPSTHTGIQTGTHTGSETGLNKDGQYYDPTTPGDEGQVKGAYGSYAEKPTTQTSTGTSEAGHGSAYTDKSTIDEKKHDNIAAGTAAAAAASAIGASGSSDGYNPITPGDEGQVKGSYGSYADNSSGVPTQSPTAPSDESQVKGAYDTFADKSAGHSHTGKHAAGIAVGAAVGTAAAAAAGVAGIAGIAGKSNSESDGYNPATPGDEGQVKGAYGSYAKSTGIDNSAIKSENAQSDKAFDPLASGAYGEANTNTYDPAAPGDEGQVKGAYGSYAKSTGIDNSAIKSENAQTDKAFDPLATGAYGEANTNSYDPAAPGDEGQVKGAYGSYAKSTGIDNSAIKSEGAQSGKALNPLATRAYGETDTNSYDPTAAGDEGQVKGAYGSYAETPATHTQEPSHKYEGLDAAAAAAAAAAAKSSGAPGGSYKNYDPLTGQKASFAANTDEAAASAAAGSAAQKSGAPGGSYKNYDPLTGQEASFSATIDEVAASAAAGSAAHHSGAPGGSYKNYDPITGQQSFSGTIDESTAAAAAGSASKSSGVPGGSYANHDPITREHHYNPATAGDEAQVKGAYGSYVDKPTTNTSSDGQVKATDSYPVHAGSHTGANTGTEYPATGSNAANGDHTYDPAARGDESQFKGDYGSVKPESAGETTDSSGHKTLGGIVAGTAAAAAAALGLGHKSGEAETQSDSAETRDGITGFNGSTGSKYTSSTFTEPLAGSHPGSTPSDQAAASYQFGADKNVSSDDDMASKKSKQKSKKRASNVPAGAAAKVQAASPVVDANSAAVDAPTSTLESARETTPPYDPLGGQDDSQVTGAYRSLPNKPETTTSESTEAQYNPTTPGDEGQVTGAYGSYAEKPVVESTPVDSVGTTGAVGAAGAAAASVPLASSGTLDPVSDNKRTSGIFSEISSASSADSAGLESETPGVAGLHRNLVDPASASTNSVNTAKLDTKLDSKVDTFDGDKSFTGPSSQEVPLESTWTDKATGLAVGAGAAVVGGAASVLASTGLVNSNSDGRDTSTPVEPTYKSLDPAAKDERYVSELSKPSGPIVTDGIQSGEAPIKSTAEAPAKSTAGIVSSDASVVSLDSRTAPIPDSGATVSGRFAHANESSDRKVYDERRHSRTSLATTGETDFEDAEDFGSPEPVARANRGYDSESVSSQSTIGKRNTAAASTVVPTAVPIAASSAPASRPETASTAATSVGEEKVQGGDGRDIIPTEVLEQPKKEIGGDGSLLAGPPVDKAKVEEVHQEVIAAAKAEGETDGIIRGGAAGVAENAAPGKHANKEGDDLAAPDKKSCRCC